MSSQKKILEFNFIKAISAIGIVIFHFAVGIGNVELLPGNYPWGSVFVTIFFMVSGALLYYNYKKPENIKLFYYKRWKSLIPDFYVAFLCVYAVQVFQNRSFFYNGHPETLLLTLIGQDGYLLELIPNYYLLGEWFLGAIIILYLLYPLLASLIEKKEIPVLFVITALYTVSLFINNPYIRDFRSVFSCVFSFVLGITIEKHKIYEHRWLAIPTLIGFIAVNFFITDSELNLTAHICGALLFFPLFAIGGLIYRCQILGKISNFLNSLSYDIFLIHHLLIIYMLKIVTPFDNILPNIVYLATDILLIIVAAAIFSNIMKYLLHTKIFLKFEEWILAKIGQPGHT
ncbi:acyltransferase [Claveliimonas bilis]|uniref:acyltransferase family protein n=1 Tax=Claveliimonas bilis TaxID=3028070 RepID=UPI001E3B1B71|nr:acyltransferase family protein [Claveliimonas bilis]BCZ27903.1 acyltransferase [Claveliimonas bilis]